jgi:hypothetical protein
MIADFGVSAALRQLQYALGLVPAELRFASLHTEGLFDTMLEQSISKLLENVEYHDPW